MSFQRYFLLVCLSVSLPASGQQADQGWGDPVKDSDGILVFARPVPGSSFKAFRADTVLPATLSSVLALLDDFSACTRWVHQCKEGRLVEETSFNDKTFYQATNMPFPVKDRDYIMQAQLRMHEDKQGVTLTMTSLPDRLEETSAIRIREITGSYELRSIMSDQGNETVALVWEQHIDPAGAIPTWLVNAMLVDIPFNSLRDFRELVGQEPYRSAELLFDASGNIRGFKDYTP
jgi:hypothetical protein